MERNRFHSADFPRDGTVICAKIYFSDLWVAHATRGFHILSAICHDSENCRFISSVKTMSLLTVECLAFPLYDAIKFSQLSSVYLFCLRDFTPYFEVYLQVRLRDFKDHLPKLKQTSQPPGLEQNRFPMVLIPIASKIRSLARLIKRQTRSASAGGRSEGFVPQVSATCRPGVSRRAVIPDAGQCPPGQADRSFVRGSFFGERGKFPLKGRIELDAGDMVKSCCGVGY